MKQEELPPTDFIDFAKIKYKTGTKESRDKGDKENK
jgi:hypothetical protein